MSYEDDLLGEGAATADSAEKDLCRDFKKGDCRRRGKCIYHHPKLDVCRDYQFRECTRQGCRFVHVTKAEEEEFDGNGILPPHVHNGPFQSNSQSRGGNDGYNSRPAKRSYSAISMPTYGHNQQSTDLCGDFKKGDCRRGDRCKFYHPKLVICRDFQKDKCGRDNCRFLHMSTEEEKTYEGNGIVPDHIDRDKLKRNQIMPGEDRYGSKRQQSDPYGSMGAPPAPSGGAYNMPALEATLQENAALKIKMQEMQQQINDLRKMNDILYEQNNNYRNQTSFK